MLESWHPTGSSPTYIRTPMISISSRLHQDSAYNQWINIHFLYLSTHQSCHDCDTRSTLYHSIWSHPHVYHLFHCMYLCFPIFSTLLVSPLLSEHSVCSVSLYDYLICFHLWSLVILCSCPILLTNMICLRELVTYITRLTHHTVQLHLPLFISIPNPLSIALYILL